MFFALLLVATGAHAQSLSPAEMIDVAGRQRMLSQRIVKAYAQLAQEIQYDIALKQLHDSIRSFEENLRLLRKNSPESGAQKTFLNIEGLWKTFRAQASGAITRDGARELIESSEALLQLCHKAVLQLEDDAGIQQARLVNIAGRQRMLSQRIAKSYMLHSWGLGNAALRDELEQARNEFEGAMVELNRAKENSPEIDRALNEVERQWIVFRGSLQLKESGSYVPLQVAIASDKILHLFNDITRMYAASPMRTSPGT
jgi:nitrate/nitrite-specific signal transduction histidine kinase